jgi:predicted nucleotidyltransferase
MEKDLKTIRKEGMLTQAEAAAFLGIPLRTYVNYENDPTKRSSVKYHYAIDKLTNHFLIDETHGILSIHQIQTICQTVFSKHIVHYCYLFGSYSRNEAREDSDVDLLISSSEQGLGFFGLAEELREALKKKVDLLDVAQLTNNPTLTDNILKDGIKIYGK